MHENSWLAERFENNRRHLRAVAYRMLGSASEAEDAVQETWLRLSRADTHDVDNLGGWLTTVTARVCLDMLRSRRSRREDSLEPEMHASLADNTGLDPEREAVLADSVGMAMLVVMESLAPAERVAFVLHDMFSLPFEEIAPIVGRTPTATRQLASRARRRVKGMSAGGQVDLGRRRELVDAFLAASRRGDLQVLIALLDPKVVLRADHGATPPWASAETRGAEAVAAVFSGRAQAAQPASINGEPGLVWAVGGRPRVVFRFTFMGEKISGIELVSDPKVLSEVETTGAQPPA